MSAPRIEGGYGRNPRRAKVEPYLPGWALPDLFAARWADLPVDAVVTMTVQVVDRAPRCVGLSVVAKKGCAVDGVLLRRLPVATLLEYAVAAAAQRETKPGHYSLSSFKSPDAFRAFRASHPVRKPRERWQLTPNHLREVAEVYRAARSAPVAAVAEHWNKPRPTASRWIAKARAEHYFDEPPAKPARARKGQQR